LSSRAGTGKHAQLFRPLAGGGFLLAVQVNRKMNVAQVAAEILKREGVEVLLTYPLNPLTETAADKSEFVFEDRVPNAVRADLGQLAMTNEDAVVRGDFEITRIADADGRECVIGSAIGQEAAASGPLLQLESFLPPTRLGAAAQQCDDDQDRYGYTE
jgi:hypothetical protein